MKDFNFIRDIFTIIILGLIVYLPVSYILNEFNETCTQGEVIEIGACDSNAVCRVSIFVRMSTEERNSGQYGYWVTKKGKYKFPIEGETITLCE